MRLDVDKFCFVCGPENPEGLKAVFEAADGKATGTFLSRPEHQGYTGVSHGGIIAALLDEAMVYAATSLGHWSATAELTVRYSKPASTEQTLTVTAEVTEQKRRLVHCRAELRDAGGTLLASATGKLMQGRAIEPGERP